MTLIKLFQESSQSELEYKVNSFIQGKDIVSIEYKSRNSIVDCGRDGYQESDSVVYECMVRFE